MPGLLALDVGEKRIGVAVNEWGDLVVPLGVIPRGPNDLEEIRRHVTERFIDRIIVGLPISLDDTLGTQAQKVLKFVERLKAVVSVPIETYDERFSTHEAEQMMIEADVSRQRRRQSIDALAAAQILKGYLSTQAERSRPREEEGG
ncbi:MAG: Holliday junction resolvase RuvX [Armatimonadetes bacterium]|nr:Holliday junction resolvase RuvX [Armatimonadota bacterium]